MPDTHRKKYLRPKKDEECPYVLNVTKNTDEDAEVSASFTRLAYRPYPELLAEVTELRRLHHWADTTYQRRLATLPAGGQLVVTMYRRGAQNADPAYLSITAKDKDGKPVFTQAALPSGNGRFWNRDLYKATQVIPFVKTDGYQPLTVVIKDAQLKQDFEYIISN